jgi:hypothetical protein
MKQAILNLKKKLLIVELPKNITQLGYSMFDNNGNCYLEYYTKDKKCVKTDIIINIGSKALATSCVDEILNELTKMDARCKYWYLVKNKIKNYA